MRVTRTAHSVYRLQYHVVWVCKYRRRILKPGLSSYLRKVLAKLLRSGYLHREIREKGGAYGGMANYATVSGQFTLLSYRDPHLARTLGVYRDAVEWAAAGRFEAQEVKEAVLGVYIHGLAGDIAAERIGETSLIASDIIGCLGEAFIKHAKS